VRVRHGRHAAPQIDELPDPSPAAGVLFAMTSTFLTGQTLHIDGGEPLT
jgi:hypothetical protein